MNRGLRRETCVYPRGLILLLSIAGIAVVALTVVLGLPHAAQVHAQATGENPVKDITGTWQGTLHAGEAYVNPGRDLRIVFKISKADDGAYKALGYNLDLPGDPRPAYKFTLEGTTVKMSIPFDGVTYEGKLAADGRTITGNVTTSWGVTIPLNLTRATAETEWTIPPPPPRLPPMDPNATPVFEVATIKPSKPGQRGGHSFQGNRLRFTNRDSGGSMNRSVCGVMAGVAGLAVAAMIILTCVDVVGRRLGHPLTGTYDIVEILGAISIIGALPYTTACKGHVAIEFLFQKLSRLGRAILCRIRHSCRHYRSRRERYSDGGKLAVFRD